MRRRQAPFIFLLGVICLLMRASSPCLAQNDLTDTRSLEQAIHDLLDPFQPRAKGLPEPVMVPPAPPPVKLPPPVIQPIAPPPPPVVVPKPVTIPKLTLSGIIFSPLHPMAIINGEVLEQGQTLSGPDKVFVKKINKNTVNCTYLGVSFTISTDQGE